MKELFYELLVAIEFFRAFPQKEETVWVDGVAKGIELALSEKGGEQ